MGRLTTHVLDTSVGKPAAGVRVVLRREGEAAALAEGRTNADGRMDKPLLEGAAFVSGRYELTFHVGDYFRARRVGLADPPFSMYPAALCHRRRRPLPRTARSRPTAIRPTGELTFSSPLAGGVEGVMVHSMIISLPGSLRSLTSLRAGRSGRKREAEWTSLRRMAQPAAALGAHDSSIGWIGTSFYFMALDYSLSTQERMNAGVLGTAWQVHWRRFYHVERSTRSRRRPCLRCCTGSNGRPISLGHRSAF
jgi:5-hydroxyisourate hydrolase